MVSTQGSVAIWMCIAEISQLQFVILPSLLYRHRSLNQIVHKIVYQLIYYPIFRQMNLYTATKSSECATPIRAFGFTCSATIRRCSRTPIEKAFVWLAKTGSQHFGNLSRIRSDQAYFGSISEGCAERCARRTIICPTCGTTRSRSSMRPPISSGLRKGDSSPPSSCSMTSRRSLNCCATRRNNQLLRVDSNCCEYGSELSQSSTNFDQLICTMISVRLARSSNANCQCLTVGT